MVKYAAPISQNKQKRLQTKKSCSKYEKLAKNLWKALSTQLEQSCSYSTFQRRGRGGKGLKSFPGFEEGQTIKNIWCINRLNFKKQINLSAVSEFPPTVSSASKAPDASTVSSSATQSAGRYFPQVRISSSVEKTEYTDAGSEL